MIFAVDLKVLAKAIDPLGEQRNLHFGGAGILGGTAELRDDFAFSLAG
jgi:hypothetical protein